MSGPRTLIHLLSVTTLLLWGGVMLFFHYSGRVAAYLPPDGIFRPMVLAAGIGLCVLGLFNLLTMNTEDIGCEGHEHAHDDDHDHSKCGHDHGHKHDHGGCCGHDHGHEHHDHGKCDHDHGKCGHEHAHEHKHVHADGCCGHDHGHEAHGHAHGILEESGWAGRLTALGILIVPLSVAAVLTPDRYSSNAVMNKGLYNPNYADTSRAEQFSLKNKSGTAPSTPKRAEPKVTPTDLPPATVAAAPSGDSKAPPIPGAPPPPSKPGEPPNAANAPKPPTEAKSYGTFTLEDLKAQVPQSKEGHFLLDVPEIYYTGGDLEVQKVLTGQMVETTAQILPEKVNNADGHRMRIFRMLVQCCAADARPFSVPIDFGKKAPDFKDMTWVKVTGKVSYKKEGDQTVPLLEVSKVEETTAPDNAMIY
ncbi:MAG: DUF1980 domain-containing protein [Verrucomicrobiaceae bacterium]|nr:DUF1980 domain-containing protein [Verrucomicrobiaceae bacterium]